MLTAELVVGGHRSVLVTGLERPLHKGSQAVPRLCSLNLFSEQVLSRSCPVPIRRRPTSRAHSASSDLPRSATFEDIAAAHLAGEGAVRRQSLETKYHRSGLEQHHVPSRAVPTETFTRRLDRRPDSRLVLRLEGVPRSLRFGLSRQLGPVATWRVRGAHSAGIGTDQCR